MPRPRNLEAIARALAAPVAGLLVPDGWRALELRLQPATVERIRAGGLPEAERVAGLYASTLPAAILEACRLPDRPPNRDGRGKRRRTRAEVLAGIAEAEAMRAAARLRALEAPEGGGGGATASDETLHGRAADVPGAELLSTFPPAPIVTAAD